MSINEALNQILLGILLGALGQGLRVVVGLKKAQDSASAAGQSFSQSGFDGTRLGISLFIGAIVGALTEMMISGFKPLTVIDQNLVFKLLAAGYAGTDAIEGLLQKYLPNMGTGNQPASATSPPAGSAPATPPKSLLSSTLMAAQAATPAPKVAPGVALQVQLDVSLAVFPNCGTPQPGGTVTVNPQFPIADACAAAPDNIKLEVNTFASKSAQLNGATWTNVADSSDISALKTIQDLMNLVAKNLS